MILTTSSFKRFFCALVLGTVVLMSCKNESVSQVEEGSENQVFIDITKKHQVVHNFGASDAWTCQFVGVWPDAKRMQIAEWLFSKELDGNGKPKGIGLSLWRFNIGAGSASQDNISDEWRRTESFLLNDGTYNWNEQEGQQWFMNAAKSHGVEKFLAFTNSPPIQFTKNGKAYSSNGEEANIAKERYVDFGKFMVDVLKQFETKGLAFDYISPFNEPQWDWTGNGQEGTPYKNTEMFAITKVLDSLLIKEGLETKIQIAEAGKLNYLYEKADKNTRGDQIYEFFNSSSPLYVGNLTSVDKIISGHSYFTSAPVTTMREVRQSVASKIKEASVPLEFWQSEYCILGDQEEVKGGGKDVGIVPALYVARLIHHDLTVSNASSWSWWLAVTAYDYKDGLVYVDKSKIDGNYEDSKLLWALGNYSRFIAPGSSRVTVSAENISANNSNGLMVSAYTSPDNGSVVIVAINYGDADTSTYFQVNGSSVDSYKGYLTGPGSDEKLKPIGEFDAAEKITIPRKSIVTLVGTFN